METQEITVQKLYVNAKGPCKIIDANGKEWKFWRPGKFGGIDPERFQEGQSYKVGWEMKPYDGKDEFYIKSISDGQSRPVPKVMHKPHSVEPRAPTNPSDSERMWCCANFAAAIQGGQVDLSSITDMAQKYSNLRTVYANTYGNPKKQNSETEFNDEVPY